MIEEFPTQLTFWGEQRIQAPSVAQTPILYSYSLLIDEQWYSMLDHSATSTSRHELLDNLALTL